MTETRLDFDFQRSLNRYQKTLLRVYIAGAVAMTFFNWTCYPGTFVGVCGWAALWPLYIPATLIRLALFGGDALAWGDLCPGPIAGVR